MFKLYYFNRNGKDNFSTAAPQSEKLIFNYISFDSFDMSLDGDVDGEELKTKYNTTNSINEESNQEYKDILPLEIDFKQLIDELNDDTYKIKYNDLINNLGFYLGWIKVKSDNEIRFIIFETVSYFPLKFKLLFIGVDNKLLIATDPMTVDEFKDPYYPNRAFLDLLNNDVLKKNIYEYIMRVDLFSKGQPPFINIENYNKMRAGKKTGLI